MEWTRQRLGELLPGLEAPPLEPAGSGSRDAAAAAGPWAMRVTKVKSVTGEVGAAGFEQVAPA
jgi:hypothetical protein